MGEIRAQRRDFAGEAEALATAASNLAGLRQAVVLLARGQARQDRRDEYITDQLRLQRGRGL